MFCNIFIYDWVWCNYEDFSRVEGRVDRDDLFTM